MSQPPRDKLLDLTVVSLPRPDEALAPELARSRLKLLAIVLVCSLPVILTYLTFYLIRPQGKATLGELIVPMRPAPAVVATRLDGSALPLASLKDQWLLVKVDGGACQSECQKQLLMLRQFRLMLGKDMTRVDWVWLIQDEAPVDPTLANNLKKDQAILARLDRQSLQNWLAVPVGAKVQGFIFVVDPLGNAMMRLPSVFDTEGARQAKSDMDRLLRASVAWDAPGRK
jgi:hypothetical protein